MWEPGPAHDAKQNYSGTNHKGEDNNTANTSPHFRTGAQGFADAQKTQGDLGFTGYEGKSYETSKYDIADRLDDAKFLHGPYVERSPAGGWPMKYALIGEHNPTMSSVYGSKEGYGASYVEGGEKPQEIRKHQTAGLPARPKDQWALPARPMSRDIGRFYQGQSTELVAPKRYPPPTR